LTAEKRWDILCRKIIPFREALPRVERAFALERE
jgi:hypothetical protein